MTEPRREPYFDGFEVAKDLPGTHQLPLPSTVESYLLCTNPGGPNKDPEYDFEGFVDLCPETPAYEVIKDLIGEDVMTLACSEDAPDSALRAVVIKLVSIAAQRLTNPKSNEIFELMGWDKRFLKRLAKNAFATADPNEAIKMLDEVLIAEIKAKR